MVIQKEDKPPEVRVLTEEILSVYGQGKSVRASKKYSFNGKRLQRIEHGNRKYIYNLKSGIFFQSVIVKNKKIIVLINGKYYYPIKDGAYIQNNKNLSFYKIEKKMKLALIKDYF